MIAAIPATTYSDLSEVSMFLARLKNRFGGKADSQKSSQAHWSTVLSVCCSDHTRRHYDPLHRSAAGVRDDALELSTLCYQIHWINRNIDSLRIEGVDWISGWGFEPVHGEQ
jgi:hypothetical protein